MKIALCLCGYFDTISIKGIDGAKGTGKKGYEFLKEKILSKYDVDCYLHCWQPDYKDLILNLYKPKNYIIEPQIDFDIVCKEKGLDQEWFGRVHGSIEISRLISSLYSRKISIDLVNEEYDWVILSRFDITQRGDAEALTNKIRFDDKLDNSFLYFSTWNQLNAGIADMWAFGGMKIMKTFGTAYDKALIYYKPESEYSKAVMEGWPDSNEKDEFTNEFLLEDDKKTKDLKKYPKWACISNHLMLKWFLIQNGLYNLTRYV